ncbi:nitrite reductase large subunit NirB [Plasticicumulans sp.]|uniref:nitrite reductase large subunit NirB n=1 Tax=Plasticicumulans sp. TaxID=2307179 RepID=UPI002B6F8B15|nr:nitrite reductase large subunit NirB [Plasticicumulans sp.]MBS0601270.1 NAD(P)/FAD-dependent oxidoreductase [Pseudomonadota bacterium]HMV37759.1 nitrite reductase large subunit NirB [Plasticicumulans sp.]HMW29937.1 nitrite reductase large subunit NirB [Plasticicumulans sp.]HMX52307.1 nitrite reductase large subunit NirB [Plasticicumulans sp.]HMZ09307.1 nitrite reductase large subunit NirB [Plasticicumulans sp.]
MKERLVLIGNGMAGMRTIEELQKVAPQMYDITVFGAEPHGNYNRIMLSPVLAGEKTIPEIMINDLDWYEQNGVTLHAGKDKEIVEINRGRREVRAADGTTVKYDRLLIATGSNPFILPLPGNDLPGVIGFRDIKDVDAMLHAAKTGKHAVVIGGGLLGLEAANGLMKQGLQVTVVHVLDTLMERQLDPFAADMLRKTLEERGLRFLMGAHTAAILGDDKVRGVRFKDGLEVPADIVVMAVGIRPNIELAKKSGIHCERGIVVNDTMQTYDPRVYSVGECVQHRGVCYGLVAPLWEQAKVCASHLAQHGVGRYEGSVTSTKLKVTGIDLFSAGNFNGGPDCEELVLRDPARGVYKKLVVKDNRVQGAVLYGDTVDGTWYFQLLRENTDITAFRETVLFGHAHMADAGREGHSVMSMSDDAEICGCNGVCKGTIVKAITEKKLFTVDDVRAHTKASASCGSCTGLVEQILAATVGNYDATPKEKPMCKCTDHPHDVVRKAIRDEHLTSLESVFKVLNWKTANGCASCRPALNYYLISTWPAEAKDDYQSRFINERVHANIQKDGTYSVVPRMWGGLTNARELRAIADAADKYNVRTVKVTGGQRIDLFGIRKEDLPKIWADLNAAGMVSGHAYGKSLRTVKTCVGSDWCRFGTQDSTGLGVKIEQMTWGSWTPHKFKMAVSGCPRNCAEATIKDFGVVCVDSGYEAHVGGNGGIHVRGTDLLCKLETEEQVLEYCGAFMQLYREEGRYLERTAPWIERVGLEYVKAKIVEDEEGRKALYARFLESQKYAQTDPWAERASAGVDAHEYAPVATIG